MRRTRVAAALAAGLALAVPGTAQAWKCPKAVSFKVKGDGQLMTEADQFKPGDRSPFTGTKLRSDGGFYYADGVTVTYKMRRVKFTAKPGAMFKPYCANVSYNRYKDSPGMFLSMGEAGGKASRKAPKVHGITTYEGSFFTTVKRGHRYTASRSHPPSNYSKGKSVLSVHRGKPMTITPWSDVGKPGSCRPGKSVSIDYRGRIRAA